MVSLRSIAAIVLSVLVMAMGAVGFAAERSPGGVSVQRSTPVFTPPAASSTITVTSPLAGGNWPAGSSQTVAWTYAENIGPSVSISMLKGATTIYTLTGSVAVGAAGKGTFTWTVPQNAAAGTGFSIVVASNANPRIKGTSGLFSLTGGMVRVVAPSAAGVKAVTKANVNLTDLITIKQPAGGEEWAPGTMHPITWEKKSGDKTGNVNIDLLKGNASYQSIAVNVLLNGGNYNWLVPASLPVGEYRVAIVKATDKNVQGTSDFFDIVKPEIVILTPHSGDKWPSGETHEMKWQIRGITPDPKTMVWIEISSWDWPEFYNHEYKVPMTQQSYPLKLGLYPGTQHAAYYITVGINDPATKKTYTGKLEDIKIELPYIEIVNLAELTAAPWVPGKSYKVNWKVRGGAYPGDTTFAFTDPVGTNIYQSKTSFAGPSGTYEWAAKSYAKKIKFSMIPKEPKVQGASFVFEVDTGEFPTLSPAVKAPAAPSPLTGELIDYKQHVSLKWQDNSGNEKEFVVERKHLAGGKGAYGEIGRVPANVTTYQDKAIPVAGSYWYRINAVNDNGSASSNEVNMTTLAPATPVDLGPVNPQPAKGPAGFCPPVAYTGDIDITIRNLGPVASSTTNALLFVHNKQSGGHSEELKTAIPALQKGESFVWHAHAAKCLEGEGPDCELNLIINYNPIEVLESDMSTNDIYFTCRRPLKLQKNPAPGTQVK